MQQLYITHERAKKLRENRKSLKSVAGICNCELKLEDDDTIEIKGDAFGEFSAKNILHAYGRGFDMQTAELLGRDNYYFDTIDLGQIFGNSKRIAQVKARVIGENGKTRRYIEEVSAVKMSIYGDTISFIGTLEEISEAKAAVETLVSGGTHKLAYQKMEAAHRKNKEAAHAAGF